MTDRVLFVAPGKVVMTDDDTELEALKAEAKAAGLNCTVSTL